MKCQNIVLYLLQLIPQATNVDRYVAHLRDLLQLADPTTISSIGMPMHNVLENNHIDLILSSSKLINNDIYIHDHELFLELVKGFITSADFSEDYFYFKVSLEIPIPPSNVQFVFPRYRIYQVGVYSTSANDCYDLVLPDFATLVDDRFYDLTCSGPDSRVHDTCLVDYVNVNKSLCIHNVKADFCALVKSVFRPYRMLNTENGLLITTDFLITCFYDSGKQRDLIVKNGSHFVHWEGLSHVLIKDTNTSKEWKIFKPRLSKGYSELHLVPIDMNFDVASFHDPMKMINIGSFRNDIINRTNKQFDQLKLIHFPNELHVFVWATYGGLVIIVLCIFGYLLRPCCYCFRCCHENDRR